MELMADLVCNFIRQRAETDAGQGHAFSVFIKFFRLQLGVAGIPDKEEVFVFHQSQFLGNCLCFPPVPIPRQLFLLSAVDGGSLPRR